LAFKIDVMKIGTRITAAKPYVHIYVCVHILVLLSTALMDGKCDTDKTQFLLCFAENKV